VLNANGEPLKRPLGVPGRDFRWSMIAGAQGPRALFASPFTPVMESSRLTTTHYLLLLRSVEMSEA
jgi:hypothetical protein